MKAVILVGGYGTRLRPLTIYHPKSVFPFMNLPMVEHQIKALAAVGVKEIILAINYQWEQIQKSLKSLQQKYKVTITYSRQEFPLGTAGPLKEVQQKLLSQDQPFFMFNSDIICDYPLEELIKRHKQNRQKSNALGTIILAEVEDPSRFGVLVPDSNDKIVKYVQKPKQYISNLINAGLYLLEPKILERITKGKKSMIEKDIFPQMAQNSELFALRLENRFWFDIGKHCDYLKGQVDYLQYFKTKEWESPNKEKTQLANYYLIDSSAEIAPNCRLSNVVIGPNVKIGEGCCLKNVTILGGTQIGSHCYIEGSIISWNCNIGKWVRIEGTTVFGEDVTVNSEIRILDSMILPNVVVNREVNKQTLMY